MQQKYTGKSLIKDTQETGLAPYIPSDGLVDAVNLMLLLSTRPLLLMGEPGCGKTSLAKAVAFDLYKEKYQDYYFEWNIKSTTKAKDGLYLYDGLKRLSDAQIKSKQHNIDNLELDAKDSYIKSGVLGKALKKSAEGKPAILLIDEIDKADIDFPNDLLTELEKFEFTIDETGVPIEAPETKPLVFITSNGEKELPPAFLRRCIFHFIEFPNQQNLEDILNARFGQPQPKYVKKAVKDFLEIRKKLERTTSFVEKKVSTSELIDWFSLLDQIIQLKKKEKDSLDDSETRFIEALKKWEESSNLEYIPFHQVLLKNLESKKALKQFI